MCIRCKSENVRKLTHREVPIKLIQKVWETKEYIRSNNEKVVSTEWVVYNGNKYAAYITYEYYDGYQMTDDFIEVTV